MYEAQISRSTPTAMIFLIDQSSSMSQAWGGDQGTSKAEKLATIFNRLLQNLVIKCAKAEGVRDYFDVAVIGYGIEVRSAFGSKLPSAGLIPISEIAKNPERVDQRMRKVEDGAGGLVEQPIKLPIWVDAVANGSTPMVAALSRARELLQPWVDQHQRSFPPIVINISDGQSTDGDPAGEAAALQTLSTEDGSALLFNVHISAQRDASTLFPASDSGLHDEHARRLFAMSSELPASMVSEGQRDGLEILPGARGFAFQADAAQVIQFLDIGTRTGTVVDDVFEDAGGPDADERSDVADFGRPGRQGQRSGVTLSSSTFYEAKLGNDPDEYEDAFWAPVGTGVKRFAVADGATESSVLRALGAAPCRGIWTWPHVPLCLRVPPGP